MSKVQILEIPLYPAYETGYYGIPGKDNGRNKVHLLINGKPACGKKPHPLSEFQWCSHGIHVPYIECQKCLKIALKIELERHEESARILRKKIWRNVE